MAQLFNIQCHLLVPWCLGLVSCPDVTNVEEINQCHNIILVVVVQKESIWINFQSYRNSCAVLKGVKSILQLKSFPHNIFVPGLSI